MLVQKKVVAGQTQHNAQGQYFRLISANSDLKITFIEEDYSEWSTIVKVGMQVPLEKLHRHIYIESPEDQILEFWWGKTPVDSMNATVIGASGVRVSKTVCSSGETLLTLPSALRKTIKIKSDQDIFVGNSGAGLNGWPIKAGIVEELPLAGSLFAYKPAPFFDEAAASFESKAHQMPMSGGDTPLTQAHDIDFAGNRFIYSGGSELWELDNGTGAFTLLEAFETPSGDLYSRQRNWQCNYHKALFVMYTRAYDDDYALIVKCNFNQTGHYEKVYEGYLSGLVYADEYNYRPLVRQNGMLWIYKSSHYYEIDPADGSYQKHTIYENTVFDVSANNSAFQLTEINGNIVGMVRGTDNQYRLCQLNENTGEFEDLDLLTSSNTPDYYTQYCGLGARAYVSSGYLYFYNGERALWVAGVPANHRGLTVIGDYVFISESNGHLYICDTSATNPVFTLIGDNGLSGNTGGAYGLGYDFENNKIYTTGPFADGNTTDASVNTYGSPLVGNLSGANVNVMEFLA